MTLNKLEKTAQKLWDVEGQIRAIEEEVKSKTAKLEANREKLRADLLDALKAARVKSVRVESGEAFVRSVRASFEVTDEEKAATWARENNCMRLDKVRASSILLRLPKVPDGFEQIDREYLTIKKSAEAEHI